MPKDYTEDSLRDAVYDVQENGLSVNQAAAKHGVPTSTLSDRATGKHNSKQDPGAQPVNSLLSEDQERQLVQWILRQEKLGFAPSQGVVRHIVSSLANSPVGNHWVNRLIKRHPELQSKIGRRQEAARFHEFTPRAVN